ncbi:antibiotic biosynthesis monooxygenase family protein [Streptosporangium sp. DT93]|uniref:antibiotic biosynthesis monooxygenase family protein n=1 Tax=Streptosporangium sp. DT93 TaxID=3393428 RepID=UPI003CEA175D
MKVAMLANHYPHAAHRDAFVERVHRVAEEFLRGPGCLSAECWLTGDAVVSFVRWESEEAFVTAFTALRTEELDIDHDERESRPREIVKLVEPPAGA